MNSSFVNSMHHTMDVVTKQIKSLPKKCTINNADLLVNDLTVISGALVCTIDSIPIYRDDTTTIGKLKAYYSKSATAEVSIIA